MIERNGIWYLTLREAAGRLNLEYSYVKKKSGQGAFEGTIKEGRNRLVPESEVERWERSAVTTTTYRRAGR